jgi:hypothetical protein
MRTNIILSMMPEHKKKKFSILKFDHMDKPPLVFGLYEMEEQGIPTSGT